ncbi:hypothetical protein CR513_27884, partial [Mucuna pruriens]
MTVNKRKVLKEQAFQAWTNYKGKGKGPWKENKSSTNQKHQDQEFGETSESSKERRTDQAQKQDCNTKNSKEWKFDKRKMRCHTCQKLGHYARECWAGECQSYQAVKGKENNVYKLKKALYGLKQAPRAWSKRIGGYLSQICFKKCTSDHGVYVKCWKGSLK